MDDGTVISGVGEGVAMFRFPASSDGPGPVGDYVNPLVTPHNWTTYEDGGGSHSGGAMDIPDALGTPLHAATTGKIIYAGWEDGGGGNVVIIQPTGKPEGIVYAHMQNISVSVGQSVTVNQVVGTLGSTGASSGPHLHLEVRRNGTQWGPWFPAYQYFKERGVDLGKQVG